MVGGSSPSAPTEKPKAVSGPVATRARFEGRKVFRPPWQRETLCSQLTLGLLIAICLKMMLVMWNAFHCQTCGALPSTLFFVPMFEPISKTLCFSYNVPKFINLNLNYNKMP